MERHYDAFLYTANWGTHQFMLRLPTAVLDQALVHLYLAVQREASQAARARG